MEKYMIKFTTALIPELTKTLKTGDVILTHGTSFLARAIRYFTRSEFNHAILVVEIWGDKFLLEAQKEGLVINTIPESLTNKQFKILRAKTYADGLPVEKAKELAMFVMPMVGKHRYDFGSLLVAQPIKQIFNVWVGRRNAKASKRLYCSEFIALVYNRMFKFFPYWYETTPKDLNESTVYFTEIWLTEISNN